MKLTAALLLGAVSAESFLGHEVLTEKDYAFFNYVSKHGKSYGTKAEFDFRKKVFAEAYDFVQEWNAGNHSHTVELNFLADRTYAEKKKLNGFIPQNGAKNIKVYETNTDDIDWRSKGGVTPVKNQGQCGSCWAFSTTGAVEGAEFAATGKLNSYSEQQLVDCAGGKYGNMGCNGGEMDAAFQYIHDNGIELEENYPYKGVDGKCAFDASKVAGDVKKFVDVTPKSVDQLTSAIQEGPVSVAIEADKFVFQLYHQGILDTPKCGNNLDHGVLVVGKGSENGKDYYVVKNSWGASWGDQGYVKIAANADDTCGILDQPSQPSE